MVTGLTLVLTSLLLSVLGSTTAHAEVVPPPTGAAPPGTTDVVEVAEVSGLLDPVAVDFVQDRIRAANERGIVALVLRLNSPGAVVDDDRVVALADQMAASEVPVAVWVGPSSAQARGAAAQLVAVATPGGVASGARVGKAGEQILPRDRFGVLYGDQANRVRDAFVRFEDAQAVGLVPAATLGDFIIDLEGVATRSSDVDGVTRREPVTTVRFVQLGLGWQLLHTAASPSVAYLVFVIGLGLIVFELFTSGIGLAGVCGAAFVVLGCYGLAVLPIRWWALALILAAFPLFAADVQIGVPRGPTLGGFAVFTVGTFALFDGVSLSWVTIVAALALLVVVYLRGMPAMVRSRFSTADIGRDWLVGEDGLAVTAVDPSGTVAVRSARFPAHSDAAGAIALGDRVTVTGASGVQLEVAPLRAATQPPAGADGDR